MASSVSDQHDGSEKEYAEYGKKNNASQGHDDRGASETPAPDRPSAVNTLKVLVEPTTTHEHDSDVDNESADDDHHETTPGDESFVIKSPASVDPMESILVGDSRANQKSPPTNPELPVARDHRKASRKRPRIDSISGQGSRAQVRRAARLVADELRSGSWPEASEGSHVRAADALEHFARDIFLPTLMARDAARVTTDRPFLATMLALREVMIQNAEIIFGDTIESDDAGSNRIDTIDLSTSDEPCFQKKLYATSVVLAAVDRLGVSPADDEPYETELLRTLESYDRGSDEFALNLGAIGPHVQGSVLNNGTKAAMDAEENVTWKVSFNLARRRHPLVAQKALRDDRELLRRRGVSLDYEENRCEVSVPNACYVAMVKKVNDDAEQPKGNARVDVSVESLLDF